MASPDEPILTETFDDPLTFRPREASAYLYAESDEERSKHVRRWLENAVGVRAITVKENGGGAISIQEDGVVRKSKIALRSERALGEIWKVFSDDSVYIDVTGLPHHVWAPLLRSALRSIVDVRIVYAEPQSYRFSATPTEGQIFDLSERIEGIRPLPGFATLRGMHSEAFVLVPMLGFEGTRLSYVMEQIQPAYDRVVPIVGVPGFEAEYPFYTYAGNKKALSESGAWQRVEFAAANCPFDVFYLLQTLSERYPEDTLKIAPIGTKPNAVGAVLFRVTSQHPTELVYDHPIRKVGRTKSTSRILVYHVSAVARAV